MINTKILTAILFVSFAFFSFGQVVKKDIDNAINKSQLKHPYLYFSDSDKPAIKDRIKNDKESNYIMQMLLAEANKLMAMPVSYDIPIQGKNTRAGWTDEDRDGKYGRYYNQMRGNAFTLAFVYQMTGDEKYAIKAFEFADAFCDLTTWTQRAHEFPIIYTRVWPWNVDDDQTNFSFDHYNGDSGRMMAAVYDWLYPALNKSQRDRIRGALLEKVITRVRGNYEYHWWATSYKCNWCGVCNSGLGLTALALLTEDPQLTDVVAESYNRIDNLLSNLGEDGGWQEGGGYWVYGTSTSTFFADALKRITKGKYNLFNNERLKNNPTTFPLYITMQPGSSLYFEDSGSRTLGETYFINKLATETGDKRTAYYRKEFLGEGDDPFDLIWPRPTVTPEAPENPSKHFRTIDWWIMRSEFNNPEKVTVAGKAGMNTDPHHGHLDVGQFVIQWKNQYYISEMGRMHYDEKYFDQARWEYPFASSVGHNVIFVNGEKQISAKYKDQPWDYSIGGKVLDFKTSPERDYVIMDPTNAYPKKELKNWRRHIVYEKPQIAIVLDEVKSAKGAEIEARFHTECEEENHGKYVLLKGKEGTMALIPVVATEFEIRDGKHAIQPVDGEIRFRWEPYFGTVLKAESENTIIATVILPVDDNNEAQGIANSIEHSTDKNGNYSIALKKAGKKYSFEYANTSAGLVLK
ncbi:MAG: heparinase II/III family protein [Ignavibacteriae bacterium]|nr:heparinase II/III family protein [Ignavibacteriota bacterium]MCB9207071.1 heparinase II/III family protein [Ignavibacteriales bacterium]MCB9211053.1 heparinase II/III family protein [Ignavibacteriales bacterium]MCB9219474.1 heparinase II/III family protein [Ignavibacteriales bacterium]MCB9259852.1 heparinase II/III family protein [Ignavibacteriales bacterium]